MTTAPKIIIINLESSADRRALMTAHLATLGLQGEFFPASDGRQMTDAEIAVVYDEKRAATTEWGVLTRGEIGCALSHRRVWQALLDSGDNGWLVLEDDAVLAPDVAQWLGQLLEQAHDGDVIPFVHTSPTPYFFRQTALGKRQLVYPNQSFIAATAYYVTPLAAQRLLAASNPIWFPIDCWYSTPGFRGVTPVRAVWPEAVVPRESGIQGSTIGFRQAHARRESVQKNPLRKLISNFRRYLKNRFLVKPVRYD
ncbi:MAG: glycosyltransferase family 25 protein [Dechloromonas sp.]|uniref:Glycosyltransferase family 25 protein n=1 Tax=Candidatus Dechloromonas phosphorivorans TaxID=2899244 RepID=A0A935MRF8_9RHOO|nr:glycosyltransferase family 25 protein [Candidatus Dechloromonas phosphorivorans]